MYEPKPEEIAKIDQGLGIFRDYIAPVIKSYYDAFVSAGFKEEQALTLTIAYMNNILRLPTQKDEK